MRLLPSFLLVWTTVCVLSFNVATAQEAEDASKPIAVGKSVKIVVVEGNRLSVEFEGKVGAIDNGSLVIDEAKKTFVINRRVPYLCYLPIVGDYLFRSVDRRPQPGTRSVQIALSE